ncbi:DUF3108 domain-containing protein [Hydrogenophaga sp.]|uniref:DUF3108 domain-containing protein n=1 Tax=Hydrogenophaga sp. TaxID=1904254 RepID=UPI003F709FBD
MPELTETRTQRAGAPRWPTLVLLGAGVLALHLLLLTGGLPDFITPAPTSTAALASAQPTLDETPKASEAGARNAPVRISTVRWIVPAPATAPATTAVPEREVAAPKPPRVPVKVAARPATPVPEAPPAPVAIAPPPPVDEPAAEPDVPDATVLAQADTPDTAQPAPLPPPATATPASPALPPAQLPASTRLQYVVSGQAKGFHYNATGTLDWELAGDRYSARMEMRMPLLGSRAQTSSGGVGPEGLMPERFADKGRSERAAHFEREHQRIRFSANTPEAELLPGAQDRLSLFLQLAGLLQARPQAYATGQVIDMQVAGTGDAEIWRFEVGEESTLALPAGELRVRHLVRQPRKEFDSTVEMWLAPELSHLPVRLKVTQANGDLADQQLSQKP